MFLKFLLAVFSLKSLACSEIIYKVIDDFENGISTLYYTSVVQGSAFYEYKLSNSMLELKYKFSSHEQADFIEVLRSYGPEYQNFGCTNPLGISIDIQIDELNVDTFKFMLYTESSSGQPDVFAYSFDLSSATTNQWFNLVMPFDKFKIFHSTSSNPVLNLNRIKAWRLTIFNKLNNHSKLIRFKSIKQLCHASMHTKPSNLAISSIFIQIWNTDGCACGQWSETRWHEELMKMDSIGIKRLIVQYTVYDKHSWLSKDWTGRSTLDRILEAANLVQNFQIVLGLYFDEKWNTFNKYEQNYYGLLMAEHEKLIDQIVDLYGTKRSFGGFYIPQEWNNVEWSDDLSLDLFVEWTRKLSGYIKLKGNFSILLSPFFRSYVDLEKTRIIYEKFLNSSNDSMSFIDEICVQDSIGVDKAYANNFISLYNTLEVLKVIVERNRVKFGVNIELFEQVGKHFVPADKERVQRQLRAAKFFTSNIFGFDWTYMMAQNYSLFNQYSRTFNFNV
ncbi:DUF4434 domain-containing [Brachionus plicatilis]|uniref:DUF4434 domain-containing n=1 Tax=Brachionus plicatilis TaxID=10195 RepID=A0A3M7QES0_BRAPC|nr:DUF4434 domain-containing [Brachionus plicatilis]